jgi:hypothetical protein
VLFITKGWDWKIVTVHRISWMRANQSNCPQLIMSRGDGKPALAPNNREQMFCIDLNGYEKSAVARQSRFFHRNRG